MSRYSLLNYSLTAERKRKQLASGGRVAQSVCLFLHQHFEIVNSRPRKHREQCGCCGSGARTKMSEDVVPWEAIRYLPLHCSRSDRPPGKLPRGRSEVEDIKKMLTEAASTLVSVVCQTALTLTNGEIFLFQAICNTGLKRNYKYTTRKIFRRKPR